MTLPALVKNALTLTQRLRMIWEGLGIHLGIVWAGLGHLWAALGRLWGAFGRLFATFWAFENPLV